jgi:hypothetical protein
MLSPEILKSGLTNQCTRIATLRFYNGYAPAKKWVIVANIAGPQSRDFKRYTARKERSGQELAVLGSVSK